MVCTSLGSLLCPLFYFLCYIHFSLSVSPTMSKPSIGRRGFAAGKHVFASNDVLRLKFQPIHSTSQLHRRLFCAQFCGNFSSLVLIFGQGLEAPPEALSAEVPPSIEPFLADQLLGQVVGFRMYLHVEEPINHSLLQGGAGGLAAGLG